MSLNITSMADIFTIILVFMLKSINSGAITVQPSGEVTLPNALEASGLSEVNPEDLKIEISSASILVEEKPAVTLDQFAFQKEDLDKNGTSRSLASVIETERKRQAAIAALNPELKQQSKVVVIADQKAPYSTIKAVLASAAVHGFTDFKLALVKPGN
jgi:biopolymer transport protein ExbD